MLSKFGRPLFQKPLTHTAKFLYRLGVTPNLMSLFGFILTVASASLLAAGLLFWGGLVLIVAASCDMLDGSIARFTEQQSVFGAFLDSTLDRYSESIALLGLTVYYAGVADTQVHLLLLFLTLVGSWAVSYTRARAEGLQLECKVGLLQRPERLAIYTFGLLTGWLLPVLWLLAVFTNITALQRIHEVYLQSLPAGQNHPATD